MKKRIASILVAAATVISVGGAAGNVFGAIPSLTAAVSAAEAASYVDTSGAVKSRSSYTKITKSTTKLDGGWYLASGKVTIDSRLKVTADSYLILEDGAKLVVKGGIGVSDGVKFNIYSQKDATAALYAGTTNGSNSTATAGYCGIGGEGAKVNLVGGNIYAVGGSGASGIYSEETHLYWTNPTDSVYSNGYNGKITIYDTFADIDNGTAYSSVVVKANAIAGCTLVPALTIDENTTELEDATYAIFDTVSVKKRMNITGDVNIVLAPNSSLRATKGITVSKGNNLTIAGQGQLLAGTTSASNFTADSYYAGIGSANNNRAGSITVKSGTVYANGGSYAAGIGGSNASVTVNGGKVYANGGSYGAGIGSGYSDNGADVRILGGTVQAKGGSYGSGIGSGYGSSRSAITLSYTNAGDSVYADSYSGTLSYLKTMYTSDGQVAAANNIGGQTLTAQVTGYTVTFNTNGGLALKNVTVKPGAYLSELPTPTRDGYQFVGWYSDAALTKPFNYLTTPISSSITLYAAWTSSVVVYFNSNGGTAVSPVYMNKGTYMQYAPATPTRAGYIFNGWYTDANLRNYFDYRYYRIDKTITLYAGWVQETVKYTVTFNSNGGSNVDSMTVNAGDSVAQTDLPFPSRAGYSFNGWYEDAACNNYSNRYTINGNKTLYAGWSQDAPAYVTVTYNANGGQLIGGAATDTVQITYNDTTYEPSDPTRNGYEFTGWYTDPNAGSRFNFNTKVTNNITLYAGWERAVTTCTVYFCYDGMLDNSETIRNVNVGDEIPVNSLAQLIKGGIYYDGWYYDAACTTPVGGRCYVSGDLTLYAKTGSYKISLTINDRYQRDYTVSASDPTIVNLVTQIGDNDYYNYSWSVIYPGSDLISITDKNNFRFDGDCYVYVTTPAYESSYAGSTFSGGGLIAAIAGGVVALGGGFAAGMAVGKKKKKDE